MKKASKNFMIWIAVLAFLILIMLVMLFVPAASDAVGKAMGKPGAWVRDKAITIATIAIGLMFISWGVAALAAAPVIGVVMIVIGAAMVLYSIWPWFKGSGTATNPSLEKIM